MNREHSGHAIYGPLFLICPSDYPSILAGAAKGVKIKTIYNAKDPQLVTQVIAIPWAHVAPFSPAVGKNLGISVILNEDDKQGRGAFIGWFSGVHNKQLDLVGDLILTE